MSTLLPDGVSLADAPFTLHHAILTALRILAYEEFGKDERPPRDMWMDGERLGKWWKQVERKRRKKYNLPDDGDDADDGDDGNGAYETNFAALDLVRRG